MWCENKNDRNELKPFDCPMTVNVCVSGWMNVRKIKRDQYKNWLNVNASGS